MGRSEPHGIPFTKEECKAATRLDAMVFIIQLGWKKMSASLSLELSLCPFEAGKPARDISIQRDIEDRANVDEVHVSHSLPAKISVFVP